MLKSCAYRLLRCEIYLASVLVLLGGCGMNLGDRVVVGEGAISINPPKEWVVDKEKSGGATVIRGDGARLSVAVLNAPSHEPEPGRLMDTLRTMSPGLSVIKQEDFSAAAGSGREFIVSYMEEGRRRDGAVYLFAKGGKLCVLTFAVEDGGLEERLDVFRASAATLKFRKGPG